MEYLNLRTYKSVKHKFDKAIRKIKKEEFKGVLGAYDRPYYNMDNDIVQEYVRFHKWSKEKSCYITETWLLKYKEI